MSKNNLTYS